MATFRLPHIVLISLSCLALVSCNKKGIRAEVQKGTQAPATSPSTPETNSGTDTEKGSDDATSGSDTAGSEDKAPVDPSALFQDCDTATNSSFVADLVKLEESVQKLPNFDNLKVVRQICLNQLNVTPRDFEGGFPGVPEIQEYFGLNINFKLNIEKAGEYKFWLNSDDGAILSIDGVKLIDNDGRHSARSKEAKINMTKGAHEMNIRYFQGPRTSIALELKWRAPGDTKDDYIPLTNVSRP